MARMYEATLKVKRVAFDHPEAAEAVVSETENFLQHYERFIQWATERTVGKAEWELYYAAREQS